MQPSPNKTSLLHSSVWYAYLADLVEHEGLAFDVDADHLHALHVERLVQGDAQLHSSSIFYTCMGYNRMFSVKAIAKCATPRCKQKQKTHHAIPMHSAQEEEKRALVNELTTGSTQLKNSPGGRGIVGSDTSGEVVVVPCAHILLQDQVELREGLVGESVVGNGVLAEPPVEVLAAPTALARAACSCWCSCSFCSCSCCCQHWSFFRRGLVGEVVEGTRAKEECGEEVFVLSARALRPNVGERMSINRRRN